MSSKILFVVAVILGLVGGIGAYLFIEQQSKGITVMVAKTSIPIDREVRDSDFLSVPIPAKFESFGRYAVQYKDKQIILGKRPTSRIDQGQLILYSQFDPVGARRAVFEQVKGPDERAISISVGMESSVTNIVEPGDYVDVIGTFKADKNTVRLPASLERSIAKPASEKKPPESGSVEDLLSGVSNSTPSDVSRPLTDNSVPGMFTRTILQRVLVLGVGQRFDDPRYSLTSQEQRSYSTVTVKVTTLEAELLVFAESLGGRLTLTLRNPAVEEKQPIPKMDFQSFTQSMDALPQKVQESDTTATADTEKKP